MQEFQYYQTLTVLKYNYCSKILKYQNILNLFMQYEFTRATNRKILYKQKNGSVDEQALKKMKDDVKHVF